jgi:hypothetical protein
LLEESTRPAAAGKEGSPEERRKRTGVPPGKDKELMSTEWFDAWWNVSWHALGHAGEEPHAAVHGSAAVPGRAPLVNRSSFLSHSAQEGAMEPEQNLSEAQREQEWELSDEEIDRSGATRGTLFPHGTATSASNREARPATPGGRGSGVVQVTERA